MFTSLITNKLAAMGVAGALTLGVLGGGVAYAQSSGTNDPTPVEIQQAAKQKPGIFRDLMADIIKRSGLKKADFRAGFKEGKSINAILGANASSVQAAVAGDVNARIAEAVTNGKLTQEQAEKLSTKVQPTLEKLFSAVPKHKPNNGHGAKVKQAAKHELDTAAKVLNMDPKVLSDQLKSGKSIAQVAQGQTQAVIDALVNDANAALDKALANGKITKEQHDKAAANVTTRVTNFVNKAHTPKGQPAGQN